MLIPAGVLLLGLAIVALQLRIVRVEGESMRPTFGPGALLLTVPARDATIRVNAVVTCPDPRDERRIVVKRVVDRLDDLVDLRGDNPEASTDSQAFGLVRTTAITARVVFALTRGTSSR